MTLGNENNLLCARHYGGYICNTNGNIRYDERLSNPERPNRILCYECIEFSNYQTEQKSDRFVNQVTNPPNEQIGLTWDQIISALRVNQENLPHNDTDSDSSNYYDVYSDTEIDSINSVDDSVNDSVNDDDTDDDSVVDPESKNNY